MIRNAAGYCECNSEYLLVFEVYNIYDATLGTKIYKQYPLEEFDGGAQAQRSEVSFLEVPLCM